MRTSDLRSSAKFRCFCAVGHILVRRPGVCCLRCVALFVACNTHTGVGYSLYAPPLYSEEVEQDEDCRE
jgi:hypothetical protein